MKQSVTLFISRHYHMPPGAMALVCSLREALGADLITHISQMRMSRPGEAESLGDITAQRARLTPRLQRAHSHTHTPLHTHSRTHTLRHRAMR